MEPLMAEQPSPYFSDDDFPDGLPDRDRILAKVDRILSTTPWLEVQALRDRVQRVVNENSSVSSRKRKLTQLMLDAVAAVESEVVCRKGCSHCCHIPVMILAGEAERLAEATGRPMTGLPIRDPRTINRDAYMGEPCPFLVDNACSVYEVRPLACRLHHNLGYDPSVCDVSVVNVVPMFNSFRWFELGYAYLAGNKEAVGDIRDFFPELAKSSI